MTLSRRNVGIAVCLLAVPLVYYTLFTDWYSVDDVGITLRYAWNAASGEGIVYNPGSADTRVQGCSTPAWFLITTFLAFFTPSRIVLLKTAYALSLVFLVLACLGIVRILDGLPFGGRRLLFASSAVLVSFCILYHREILYSLGMETPLWLATSVWAIIWYTDERPRIRRRGLLVMMVGGLVRFEFAVLAAVLFLRDFSRRWRERSSREARSVPIESQVRAAFTSVPWRNGLLYSAPVLAWMAFSQWYFGSPLPWTLHVKLEQAAGFSRWRIFANNSRMLFHDPSYLWLIPFALVGVYKTVTGRRQSRASGLLYLLLVWAIVYAFVEFFVLGAPGYAWYRAPVHVAYITMAGVGIYYLGSLVRRPATAQRSRRRAAFEGTAAALGGLCVASFLVMEFWMISLQAHYNCAGILPLLREAGEYLSATDPRSRANLSDIGMFGFFYEGYVADLVGLVAPKEDARRTPVMYHIWLMNREPEPTTELVKRFRGKWLDEELGYAEVAIYRTPLGTVRERWRQAGRDRGDRLEPLLTETEAAE